MRLGIEINRQRCLTGTRERRSKVKRGCCLADAAFLIEHRDPGHDLVGISAYMEARRQTKARTSLLFITKSMSYQVFLIMCVKKRA